MQARAWATRGSEVAFGNINVVFFGDLGQLKPVKALSFFSHELVSHILPHTVMTVGGQSALIGAYLWRMVRDVVILRKNWRAQTDPRFINLLARVREGIAWDGRGSMTPKQLGNGENYGVSDFVTLEGRLFHRLSVADQRRFSDAPVIVATKVSRDLINMRFAKQCAKDRGQTLATYKSIDRYKRQRVDLPLQKRLWKLRSRLTKDALGELPLCIGMQVVITENIAIKASVVNGARGLVEQILYDVDEDDNRYIKCVFISLEATDMRAHGMESKWVPIFPVASTFVYKSPEGVNYSVTRSQAPLLPAYASVDYKVQGRSMNLVNVDLSDCRSLQSVYVMLSRATSLDSLCVLRPFPAAKLFKRMAQEFRDEFARLERLHTETEARWLASRDRSHAQY
jgi:ATP-dependent DNA helicase PIF1